MARRAVVRSAGAEAAGVGAYRGYLICCNAILGLWWVEKGGTLIGHCRDAADGRAQVDALLGEVSHG